VYQNFFCGTLICPLSIWQLDFKIGIYLLNREKCYERFFKISRYNISLKLIANRRPEFVWPITSFFHFKTISLKWSPYWDDVSRALLGALPWRSRWQYDLAAKSSPAHNFLIWSRILKLVHWNDHRIETTCHMQHLGHYLEGQGHTMTLQHIQPTLFVTKYPFEEHHPSLTGLCS